MKTLVCIALATFVAAVPALAQDKMDKRDLDTLQKLAQAKGVKLPDNPGKKNEAEAKKLQGLSGAAFDREYMSHMMKDHEEDLKLVQKTAQGAKDPDLKAAAQKAEPIVKDHLDMAKRVNASLGKGESKK